MTAVAGNPDFPENLDYWEAIARGELLFKRCTNCSKPHYYPRAHCPFCSSPETVWEVSSGEGEIYSYTIVHFGTTPYCPAYVTLDEGPTMMTTIIDCDPAALTVGARVRLLIRPGSDGTLLPMFRLSEEQSTFALTR